MEREGIYYFFEQTDQGAKMVIADSSSAHQEIKGQKTVPYSPPSGLIPSEEEIVKEFVCQQNMLPAKVVLKDHNYRKPGLEAKAEATVDSNGSGEVYLYGEHFKDPGQGNELAKIRAEELLCRETVFCGEATAPAFSPGFIFEVTGHYRDDCDQRYLITEVIHEGSRAEDLLAGLGEKQAEGEEKVSYTNRFVCIPADVQFRPERKTPKPKFYGTMNAIVDAAGDGQFAELDEQGRYKVILPLDLSGRSGGKASRFVRMAQPYSGFAATDGVKGPSGMHFPLHKGAVDGDPDRPIISSSIPNPETTSPVTSENQTKSLVRDNYGNELIFDSTPGDEHIRLHSPHHNSGLELGRSLLKWTSSDTSELALGNAIEAVLGNKVDLAVGTSVDAKVGFVNDITVGFGVDTSLGGQLHFNLAYDLKSNIDSVVQCSEKDVLSAAAKDQILSAGDQVCIIGGEGASPEKNSRSIVNVFPEKLIMSVGNKSDTFKIGQESREPTGTAKDGEIFSKSPPLMTLVGCTIPALLAVGGSGLLSEVAHFGTTAWKGPGLVPSGKTTKDLRLTPPEFLKWDVSPKESPHAAVPVVTAVVAIVYAYLVRYLLRKYISEGSIEPVGQKEPAARIEMDHEGHVKVNSKESDIVIGVGEGPGPSAREQEDPFVQIHADGAMISANKDESVTVFGQKKVFLRSPELVFDTQQIRATRKHLFESRYISWGDPAAPPKYPGVHVIRTRRRR
jgi:Rhs element Vgr protein